MSTKAHRVTVHRRTVSQPVPLNKCRSARHDANTQKQTFAHLGVSQLPGMRSLEEENPRLKQVVADLTLDKPMLAEAFRKSPTPTQRRSPALGGALRPRPRRRGPTDRRLAECASASASRYRCVG